MSVSTSVLFSGSSAVCGWCAGSGSVPVRRCLSVGVRLGSSVGVGVCPSCVGRGWVSCLLGSAVPVVPRVVPASSRFVGWWRLYGSWVWLLLWLLVAVAVVLVVRRL